MVICLERDADLHMAQLMTLPLTVSCFSKIQIGFTFLVPAHLGSPGKRAVKQVCVCACADTLVSSASEVTTLWRYTNLFIIIIIIITNQARWEIIASFSCPRPAKYSCQKLKLKSSDAQLSYS